MSRPGDHPHVRGEQPAAQSDHPHVRGVRCPASRRAGPSPRAWGARSHRLLRRPSVHRSGARALRTIPTCVGHSTVYPHHPTCGHAAAGPSHVVGSTPQRSVTRADHPHVGARPTCVVGTLTHVRGDRPTMARNPHVRAGEPGNRQGAALVGGHHPHVRGETQARCDGLRTIPTRWGAPPRAWVAPAGPSHVRGTARPRRSGPSTRGGTASRQPRAADHPHVRGST